MTSKLLQSVELFNGIADGDLRRMLGCIGAIGASVRKDEIILLAGDRPRHVGIVLTGQFYVFREDYDGNRSLLAALSPGEIFAATICCAAVAASPVTVTATTDSTVMLLDFLRILHTCPNSCTFHTKLIGNMLKHVASRSLLLQDQMEIVGLKSVRAKVLRYLASFVPRQGMNIAIPFNREQMANFLRVERSALSHELARMKKDGLIEYRKNIFILKRALQSA